MDWEALQQKKLKAEYVPEVDEEEIQMFMRDDIDESQSKGIDEEDASDQIPLQQQEFIKQHEQQFKDFWDTEQQKQQSPQL